MGELQKAFKEYTGNVPKLLLGELFRKKLHDAGRSTDDEFVDGLVERIFNGNSDVFHWDDGTEDTVTLSLTDEDIQELDRKTKKFLKDDLPLLIVDSASSAALEIVKTLRSNWPEQYISEATNSFGFRERLELRWGKPLAFLRMILTVSREMGGEKYRKFQNSRSERNRYKNEVLFRLQARACQIMSEIEHLLSAGFADGAMARWRTMHEICVIAELIAEHGDDLAERYLAHNAVENSRGLKLFEDTYKQLGYSPPSKRKAAAVHNEFAKVIANYGQDFKNEYGWAAKVIGKSSPRFVDLEVAAGRARMRSHYKMASYMVHAGVKGITFNLGTVGNEVFALAGSSNAGLEEPGQNAAITMTQINLTLFGAQPIFDDIVMMKVLASLQEHTVEEFVRAGRKLTREERELRKQNN